MRKLRRPRAEVYYSDHSDYSMSHELLVHEPKPSEPTWSGLYDHRGIKLYRPAETPRPVGFLHPY